MEKITYQGKLIEVVEKTVEINGKEKVFEFARRSPGVRLIIPTQDGILISKEFRHELGAYDFRLPGGKVFDSLEEYNAYLASGEDIIEPAKRAAIKEAKEELGIETNDITFFHKSVCGATVIWDLFYFIVNSHTKGLQTLEEGEDITEEVVSKERIKEMCLSGEISEERSALVVLRYLENA
jgi:ADP-ribose pyrophosphatase